MTIDAKTAELALPTLRQARQIISCPENWIQDPCIGADSGKHCVVTAIIAARNRLHSNSVAAMPLGDRDSALDILVKFIPASYSSIIGYNDAPGRTHAEVLCLLDNAIDCCEGVLFGCAYLRQPPAIKWRNRACVGEALAMAHANDDWDMWHGDEFVDVQII